MRIALYFTPPRDHPLTRAAADWLMRDAFTGEPLPQATDTIIPAEEIAPLTAEPRRYGFHATLKAPFRLAEGASLSAVESAAAAFAKTAAPCRVEALQLQQLGSFFALTPGGRHTAIDALAAEVVEHFDRYRAPLTEDELARRRKSPLTPAQDANLVRWGYPYVMDDFRFHMTLTGPVTAERQAEVGESLRRRFAAFVGQPLDVDALAIFVQPDARAEFVVQSVHRLDGR